MPFGTGFGELVLILVITVVVFGATKLPQLGNGRDSLPNAEPPRLLLQRRWPHRWTLSDWALLVAAVTLVVALIANALSRR